MFLIERALETDSAPTMLTNMADAIVGAFTILYFASSMITLYGVAEEGRALN